jgi:biopolymer transport protein ExbB/TolQ
MDTNVVANAAEQIAQPTNVTSVNTLQYMATFMHEGGMFMWVILAIWIVGLAIAFERIKKLRDFDVNSLDLMTNVKKNILLNKVDEAIQMCSNTSSVVANMLKAALQRSNQSKEQIKDAVESTILEAIPKVEKRIGHLGLVANVSTLIGLLGTIQGLIESFAAVAGADPAEKAKLLALGISKAMNTTALGLISAISIMVIHQMLSSKSEKIIAELDECSIKIVDLLNSRVHKKSIDVPVEDRKEIA